MKTIFKDVHDGENIPFMDQKTRKAEMSIHELIYRTTEQKSLLVALVCLFVECDLLIQGYEGQRDHWVESLD